jgi:hypothetical protein
MRNLSAIGSSAIFSFLATLSACAGEVDDNPDAAKNFAVETRDDGAIEQISKLPNASSALPERAPGELLIDKAGCTHIRFCNGGSVICDTDDNLARCTRSQRFNECISDANFVCGTDWTSITFDPPI